MKLETPQEATSPKWSVTCCVQYKKKKKEENSHSSLVHISADILVVMEMVDVITM